MRTFIVIGALGFALTASAQQNVQMECRKLTTTDGNLHADETLVNGLACHVVDHETSTKPNTSEKPAPAPEAKPVTQPAVSEEKVRAFISDSKSWEISGGFGGGNGAGGGETHGGARPQTAEIVKTFGERCPSITVTMRQEKADYVVLLDHEGGKGYARKDNKVVVFYKDGDSIFSHSTRSLGNSVKDACEAIETDQARRRH